MRRLIYTFARGLCGWFCICKYCGNERFLKTRISVIANQFTVKLIENLPVTHSSSILQASSSSMFLTHDAVLLSTCCPNWQEQYPSTQAVFSIQFFGVRHLSPNSIKIEN